jgi:hypothetical protein
MSFVWLLPFGLQGLAIAIDEFCFHRNRGLPLWERISHPIDTFALLLCLLYPLSVGFSPHALRVYVALCVLSCLSITKDEFVHTEHCTALEHWLHAILFVLHPIVLCEVGWLWRSPSYDFARPFLVCISVGAGTFLFYQLTYWSWSGHDRSLEIISQ